MRFDGLELAEYFRATTRFSGFFRLRARAPTSLDLPQPDTGHWLQSRAGSPFLRGALEALLVPLAFAALGLAWWGGPERAAPAVPTYPATWMESNPSDPASGAPAAHSQASAEPSEDWLVDGFNVVQVGLLRDRSREGWWTAERREELVARVAGFTREGAHTWIVFDGPQEAVHPEASGRLHTVFAASADDWLVARVKAAADPARVVVVTADRRLANRVRHHGGRVVAPGEFLRECRPVEDIGELRSV
jgi:predicted RNA-binding protein with PIN domain